MTASVCRRGTEPGSVKDRSTCGVQSRKNSSVLCLENLSPLPSGSISEAEILGHCPAADIRARLAKYNVLVRDGKFRRIVVDGMAWYIPVLGVAL